MSALQLTDFGEPADVVTLTSTPAGHPGGGEVLVALEAATINPSDLNLIRGRYGVRPELPAPLGVEGVGRILETGPDVDAALVGRRVVILPNYERGTWANETLLSLQDVVVVDDAGDPLQLAMIGISAITAVVLLRQGALSPGDWIAQTGANSAVGQYIIQLAKLDGVKTLNVVRREAAAEQVTALGGDRVVIQGDDLPEQLDAALGGQELELVFDSVGGPVVAELAHKLRIGGKVVSFGGVSGLPTALAVRDDLLFRQVSHHGFWIVNWLRATPREEVEATYREVVDLVAQGVLKAEIDRTFPLGDYAEALAYAGEYARPGKVLFAFDGQAS